MTGRALALSRWLRWLGGHPAGARPGPAGDTAPTDTGMIAT